MTCDPDAEANGAILGLREQIISNAIRIFPITIAKQKSPDTKRRDFFDVITIIEPEDHKNTARVPCDYYRAILVYDGLANSKWETAISGPRICSSRHGALQALLVELEKLLGKELKFLAEP